MKLKILILGLGGFLGSNFRFWLSDWACRHFQENLPYGTLIVNILGSFLLGIIMCYATESKDLVPLIKLFLGTGMMGAFTTFSALSFETLEMLKKSNYRLAILNTTMNITLGIAAVWIGYEIAKIAIHLTHPQYVESPQRNL
ncbi:fluoride efflux transporter CrcB [Geosporobacter ferrireducens]|uniref:Fluoride-specific ion channel FluC n=1 Tax=Geosporobacter ferrireducens TaxID=1424294 RepID=A0A1D8GDQ0_9FIRM|nr:fluoride efflux transporter CrcB [Geosporobacter ferrireducens]AOT68992.1 hypothetical protein Gferi_05125 [Geosporobacter ferrireducens]MTI58341.1 fluoride efflux transporter CrcB [Geosporobacter ferrireducens]